MREMLHSLFGGSLGGLITGVFLIVAMLDIALYRLLLGPMYDRIGTPEGAATKKTLRLAMYGGAAISFLLGLCGVAVLAGAI